MNSQKPEARSKGDGQTLDLHSMFYTIQGEGPFAGHRAIFVRLAGCNLQCPGCDTEYTEGRRETSIGMILRDVQILEKQNSLTTRPVLVVITGGEPLRQTIGHLVNALIGRRYPVQIESNGVFAPDDLLDRLLAHDDKVTLVVSPKTKRINERTAFLASCFKYVLDAGSVDPLDGLPVMALEHPASTGVARPPAWTDSLAEDKPIYLNPYDAKDDQRNAENLRAVATSCMKHGYITGVQMHKLIGLE